MFLLGGTLSVLDTIVEFFFGRINLNLGALIIFIGLGLRRFNPRSLAWARFFTGIGLIFMPIAAAATLFTATKFHVFGLYIGQAPRSACFVLSIAMFALYVWQFGVLRDRRVRRLFAQPVLP